MRIDVTAGAVATVAAVYGDLDKLTCETARAQLEAAAGAHRLVVDLAGVGFVDSAGLQTIFGLARTVERLGGTMEVVAPADSPVRRVLEIATLDAVVPVLERCPAASPADV
jgi:stage II sporulation protein AA (anti-sigma F factor antagonist)